MHGRCDIQVSSRYHYSWDISGGAGVELRRLLPQVQGVSEYYACGLCQQFVHIFRRGDSWISF